MKEAMNIPEIRHEIEELLFLVKGWEQNGEMPIIESDIALVKLGHLYEKVRFASLQPHNNESVAHVDESNEEVNEPVMSIDLDDFMLLSATEAISNQSDSVTEPETIIEPKEETEPEAEIYFEPKSEEIEEHEPPKVEEVADEPMVEEEIPLVTPRDNVLFAMEPIAPKQSRRRRSVLMSLYGDDVAQPKVVTTEASAPQTPTTPPAPAVSSRPQRSESSQDIGVVPMFGEPVLTLADTLNADVETVADRFVTEASSHPVVSDSLAFSSFEELGLNERYLLARDLFGEDSEMCIEELTKISAFDDYDDAVIYIAENFNWNSEAEGTKLLLSVLENKFNIR